MGIIEMIGLGGIGILLGLLFQTVSRIWQDRINLDKDKEKQRISRVHRRLTVLEAELEVRRNQGRQ